MFYRFWVLSSEVQILDTLYKHFSLLRTENDELLDYDIKSFSQ